MNPIWLNPVEEAAFREKTCARCYQPDEARKRIGQGDGCPLLASAAAGVLPTQWTPRRNAVMGDTYHCAARVNKPPSIRRKHTSDEQTESLFEVEPVDDGTLLVPVDGWPDYRAEQRKNKEGDHQ